MRQIVLLPPQERLLALFEYDPIAGVLRWKKRPRDHFRTERACAAWNGKLAGKAITKIASNGYANVGIDGKLYLVHRIIFKMMTGRDPAKLLDHKDTDKQNNRWHNLREAGESQNKSNSRSSRPGGLKGAHKQAKGSTWRAELKFGGKRFGLGNFPTEQAAHAAYCVAAAKHHGEFANVGVAA